MDWDSSGQSLCSESNVHRYLLQMAAGTKQPGHHPVKGGAGGVRNYIWPLVTASLFIKLESH